MEERVGRAKETEAVFDLGNKTTFAIWINSNNELPIVNVFLFLKIFSIGK